MKHHFVIKQKKNTSTVSLSHQSRLMAWTFARIKVVSLFVEKFISAQVLTFS